MAQFLFIDWAKQYLPGITIRVVNKLNDEKRLQPYRFLNMLTPRYSVTGQWNTVSTNGRMVMADVVAMDSSLPLKSRPAASRASGDIAKMGLEFSLNEKQLTDLDTMIAQNIPPAQIISTMFADVPRAVSGIYERIEYMLLEALSTGIAMAVDTDNVGTGIRLDYQVPTDHKRGVVKVWSDPTAARMDDIQKLVDVADVNGDVFVHAMADRTAIKQLLADPQFKQYYAYRQGFAGDKTIIPNLDENVVTSLFQDRWGITLEIVNRKFKQEANGVITNKTPWADGTISFLTDRNVGDLVYATLAEDNHRDEAVIYQKANDYILVSRGVDSKPSLREYTKSQARVAPAINGDVLYILDTKTVQA
ncbi:major capsid protein [Niabella sp. CC-SYL272]|uniref:major capsid protein n=1 Tax=Niabella agricola TaxID=2891571 RepID=UPI001F2D69D6|nr:major capsid protein [Niabella agricola]MCF3107319.1 major capsid protein [Niabella agricola]